MLQRMLIDKMENRILVGIVSFVGIMVLVGWVAINENARMRAFDEMFLARSIERGAEQFAANCSTCHGNDGRGIGGRGPALNSPHFFGHDYFAAVTNQTTALQNEENALNNELDTLREELVSGNVNDERRAEILERRDAISDRITGEGGIREQLEDLQAQMIVIADQLLPAADNGYPVDINANGEVVYTSDRLAQVNWSGTLYDFVFTTLVHGRPTSISYWGSPGNEVQMVSWSQRTGGPLRDDQIDDLTNFILNWDKGNNWTIEDALAVRQYAIVPGIGGTAEVVGEPAGTNVAAILQQIADEGITGDALRGEAIYNNRQTSQLGARLGCSGCHAGGVAGPATDATWDNTLNLRLNDPDLAGYTAEEYIVESIVLPQEYIVDGWGANMPGGFGQSMSVQDIADVILYLRSYSDADHSDNIVQPGEPGMDEDADEDSGDGDEA